MKIREAITLEFHQLDRRWEHLRVRQQHLQRRFDRSVSWVSRRLALVELLPESIQQQVREGAIAAQLAMKYLVPVARVSVAQCAQMAAAFVRHRCDTRQAGQLYAAWRDGSRVVRERILAEPELFLKTQRQPPSARPAAAALERELEMAVAILHRAGPGGAPGRETEKTTPRRPWSANWRWRWPSCIAPAGGAHRKGTGNPTC